MEEIKPRKNYGPEFKFKIVKEQLTTKTPVTEICKKYDITAGVYYRWLDQFYSAALDGFKNPKVGPTKSELKKIIDLEKHNARMKEVICEITSENISLKKTFGE